MRKYLFTSESVTEGHPDKMCDQISDAILDEVLKSDPCARVACETTVTTGYVNVMGEISTNANVQYQEIVRKVITDIGYISSDIGYDGNTCAISIMLDKQSDDIALGVNDSIETRNLSHQKDIGAGDQGMVFGYACDDTPELMPLPICLAHRLAKRLADVRKNGTLKYLRPDGKTQVTVAYENHIPKYVDTVVISAQHDPSVDLVDINRDLIKEVINYVIPCRLLNHETKILVNPTGRFVIGGPRGDSGLTGRKIIVDTYGGFGSHGGGAFSGKDPTKVDRSAAYAARYVAKNIVASKLAKRCEVQIAYAIGVSQPVSVMINTYGTAVVKEEVIENVVKKLFDLRPSAIIDKFELQKPIYKNLSSYGHMGREDLGVKWEETDKKDEIYRLCHLNLMSDCS